MRLSIICITALAAIVLAGIANASPLVLNGDFSQTSPTPSQAKQFTQGVHNSYNGGEFVSDWQGQGYAIWYPDATSATNGCGVTEYHSGSGGDCSSLWSLATAPSGVGAFVGLDGQSSGGLQASIWQQLAGLTPGDAYNVSFDWATAQEAQTPNQANYTEALQVSLGAKNDFTHAQATDVESVDNKGSAGWFHESFQFVANSANDWLNFLSVGTPANGPPIAILTNVSMTSVPEPPILALFGGGLLGLGLLLRRRGGGGDKKE
jgi:hypothetical protein